LSASTVESKTTISSGNNAKLVSLHTSHLQSRELNGRKYYFPLVE
jgi:Mor family transcriptional regulator